MKPFERSCSNEYAGDSFTYPPERIEQNPLPSIDLSYILSASLNGIAHISSAA